MIIGILIGLGTGVLISLLFFRRLMQPYFKQISSLENENESLLQALAAIQRIAAENYISIMKLDRNGLFSSMDEIGFIYKYLAEMSLGVKTYLEEHVKTYGSETE